jgi:hypothetical protein
MPKKITRKLPWETTSSNQPHGGRINDNAHIYNSRQWRAVSKAFLSANPFCQCPKCSKSLYPLPSQITDHKRRINDGADPFDESNFQAMSIKCHNSKSAAERHGNQSA